MLLLASALGSSPTDRDEDVKLEVEINRRDIRVGGHLTRSLHLGKWPRSLAPGFLQGLMAGGELIASGYGDASFIGPARRWRAGRGGASPGRLPPQVGAGDDLGQDAQPPPHRLPMLRRVNRRRGDGVRGRPAGPVPADIAFVLSHHIPPPVAGVNYPPEPAFAFQSDGRLFRHKPLERWFIHEPPYRVSGATPRW